MNRCESIRADLDAYRDKTLDENRRLELCRHLSDCIACSKEINRAAAIEQELRDNASNWTPPGDLWARIKNSSDLQDLPVGLTSHNYQVQLPWMIAALLLLTLGVFGFSQLQQEEDKLSNSVATALVNEFHTFVVSRRKLDYAQTLPVEIRKWFGNKLDFRVPAPLQTPGLQLAGGRLCNMLAQRVASYMYRADDAWVSLYIMKSPPAGSVNTGQSAGNEMMLQGYGYIDWEKDGLHYSLIGDIPVSRLRQFAVDLNSTHAHLGVTDFSKFNLTSLQDKSRRIFSA